MGCKYLNGLVAVSTIKNSSAFGMSLLNALSVNIDYLFKCSWSVVYRRALGAPVRVVLGTLMTAIGGIIGGFKLVARLLGRRSQDDMINATEAENKDLHEKLQVQRMKEE